VNHADSHPLVPKDKLDVETAQRAVAAVFPAVEPVLYQLLEWIQDCNWPVARELFSFLASIGEPLAPHIRGVFASDDYVWQYWICCLFAESPSLYALFREDIHRIAASPTTTERLNELDERCRNAIVRHEAG